MGRSKYKDPAEGAAATQEGVNTPPHTHGYLQESGFHTCPVGKVQLFLLHLGKLSPLEEPWVRVPRPSRGRGSVPTVLLPPKRSWSLDLGCCKPRAFLKGTACGSVAAGRPGQARPRGLGAGRQMGDVGQDGVMSVPTGSCPLLRPEVQSSLTPVAAPALPQALLAAALLGAPGDCRRRWWRKC